MNCLCSILQMALPCYMNRFIAACACSLFGGSLDLVISTNLLTMKDIT